MPHQLDWQECGRAATEEVRARSHRRGFGVTRPHPGLAKDQLDKPLHPIVALARNRVEVALVALVEAEWDVNVERIDLLPRLVARVQVSITIGFGGRVPRGEGGE
jgi:hypothetical protein